MKWIDICSIYLNYTSPDTAQALFYISVGDMHLQQKIQI